MTARATYPVAPTVTKAKGTLLDAATVGNEYAWLNGEGLFDSFNGMEFGYAPVFCGPNAKNFDQNSVWVDGFQFGVYGGVTCKMPGLDLSRRNSEAQRVFEAGESKGVERALMETRFRADADTDADGNPDRWNAPVDLTPAGGAVKPSVGMALLEGYMGAHYVGAPTLHVPRTVTSLVIVSSALEYRGDTLYTRLDSKVASGSGYEYPNTGPDGTEPAAGELWLYASGEVWVGRSEAIIRDAFDQSNNDALLLVERGYIAAVDGPTAAVRVSVTA